MHHSPPRHFSQVTPLRKPTSRTVCISRRNPPCPMTHTNLLTGYDSDPSSDEQDRNNEHLTPPPPPVNLTSVPSTSKNPQSPSQTKVTDTENPVPSHPPHSPRLQDQNQTLDVSRPPKRPAGLTKSPPSHPPLPPDVARELSRSGHLPSDVTFINVDARASTHLTPSSHTPAPTLAIQSRANRIAKSSTHISRLERRKHQITALAADAQALETARRALGGGALGREVRGRRGGRR